MALEEVANVAAVMASDNASGIMGTTVNLAGPGGAHTGGNSDWIV